MNRLLRASYAVSNVAAPGVCSGIWITLLILCFYLGTRLRVQVSLVVGTMVLVADYFRFYFGMGYGYGCADPSLGTFRCVLVPCRRTD